MREDESLPLADSELASTEPSCHVLGYQWGSLDTDEGHGRANSHRSASRSHLRHLHRECHLSPAHGQTSGDLGLIRGGTIPSSPPSRMHCACQTPHPTAVTHLAFPPASTVLNQCPGTGGLVNRVTRAVLKLPLVALILVTSRLSCPILPINLSPAPWPWRTHYSHTCGHLCSLTGPSFLRPHTLKSQLVYLFWEVLLLDQFPR